MVKKGDFFALMFFVMALAVLLAYAVLGWITNVVAAVSRTVNSRHAQDVSLTYDSISLTSTDLKYSTVICAKT